MKLFLIPLGFSGVTLVQSETSVELICAVNWWEKEVNRILQVCSPIYHSFNSVFTIELHKAWLTFAVLSSLVTPLSHSAWICYTNLHIHGFTENVEVHTKMFDTCSQTEMEWYRRGTCIHSKWQTEIHTNDSCKHVEGHSKS